MSNLFSNYGGLELALRGMAQANVDLGILKDTNIIDGFYERDYAGFSVAASDASIRHRRGVSLL